MSVNFEHRLQELVSEKIKGAKEKEYLDVTVPVVLRNLQKQKIAFDLKYPLVEITTIGFKNMERQLGEERLKIRYASKEFLNYLKAAKVTVKLERKCLLQDIETIEDFLNKDYTKPQTGYKVKKTLDFFAVFIGFEGWMDAIECEFDIEKKYQNLLKEKREIPGEISKEETVKKNEFIEEVTQFLTSEYSEKYIIEAQKKIVGLSGIERISDFYLILKSENISFETIIDIHYSTSKVSLLEIEGLISKYRDCGTHKAGIITNIGFEATATKLGMASKLLMIVIPSNSQLKYVSHLKGQVQVKEQTTTIITLKEKEEGKKTLPLFLKKKTANFHFGIDLDNTKETYEIYTNFV